MKNSQKHALEAIPGFLEAATLFEARSAIKVKYQTYENAVKAVRKFDFQTVNEYEEGYKRDPLLPRNPDQTYKSKGWISWQDFLGTIGTNKKNQSKFYASYEEASSAAKKLGFLIAADYNKGYRQDPLLPYSPDRVYERKGWISWPHFLRGKTRDKTLVKRRTRKSRWKHYVTYEEAANAASKLGFRNYLEYIAGHKRDPLLPYTPHLVYKNKWISWHTFLGVIRNYITYEEALAATRKLGFQTEREYKEGYKRDPLLPSNPAYVYRNKGWISWPVFLRGKGNVKRANIKSYSTYNEAAKAVRKLNFRSAAEYWKGYKRDPCLPCRPEQVYAGTGWVSWPHFLRGKVVE